MAAGRLQPRWVWLLVDCFPLVLYPLLMMRLLQDPDLPARFPVEMRPSRDEGGETLVVVRCNDGTIWVDTGNDRRPWRRLAAIPEPTD